MDRENLHAHSCGQTIARVIRRKQPNNNEINYISLGINWFQQALYLNSYSFFYRKNNKKKVLK